MAKFSHHLIAPDLCVSYDCRLIFEVSLYCNKIAKFGTNTHEPYLYFMSFGHLAGF